MQAPCFTTALAIVLDSCGGGDGAGAQGRYGPARKTKTYKNDIHLTSFHGYVPSGRSCEQRHHPALKKRPPLKF